MCLENEVDINLLYLERLILSLNSFTFDDDVLTAINDLRLLVCDKLYNFIPNNNYDIKSSSVKMIFIFENEKK